MMENSKIKNTLLSVAALLCLCLMVKSAVAAVDPLIEPTTTLNCALPTEREDGTPLVEGEISQIRFYSGNTTGDYSLPVNTTQGVCQWVIDNTTITDGSTLYIVVTAIDTDGRESVYSPEKTHTVIAVKLPKAPTWLD